LAARGVRVSADGRTYRFMMRPKARFHDGAPLTAHDAAFSLALLKTQGHPNIRQLLRECEGAEALDDATLIVRFLDGRARERPPGAQGWFFNARREKFRERALRDALNYAFDFEWVNKNLMYSAYKRTHSVFQNTDLVATGKPSTEELALLEPFRGKVHEEVFGEPFVPPVSDGSGQDRALLRKATQILRTAGYAIKDHKLVDPRGERVVFEFLPDEPTFEPHHAAFLKNLAILGIDATVRNVDAVQYRRRRDEFD